MRVTTAFNRVLELPGASVTAVNFAPEGTIIAIRNRSKLLYCPCGFVTRGRYDTSRRRWRHLDLSTQKLFLEGEIRRLWCKDCEAVVTEDVPWARSGARHTKDFEDVITWLCQRSDKTTVSSLMRCSWTTVDSIVNRVVDEHLDDSRLDNLYRIGVDEIAYKKGHNYLTIVADHDSGHVVWIAEGKHGAALEGFFKALGPERRAKIEAVSMDFGTTYRDATKRSVPDAVICFDPFHLIQMANRALDSVYKQSRFRVDEVITGREWRSARAVLRGAGERLKRKQMDLLNKVTKRRRHLGRAWELKELLRELYRKVKPRHAKAFLKRWITSALRSRIPAFQLLAKSVKRNFDGIVAAVERGLANTRLEGINGHIRVIQRRSHGLTNADSLASMIYLCRGGIEVKLPTQS